MKKYLLTALLVLGLAATVYAAPVGLTSEADTREAELWADNNIGLSAGILVDSVSSRSIDVDSGEFEMNAYAARLGMSIIDRFNVYVDLGQALDMEFEFSDSGDLIQVKYEDEFMWGVGATALVYRWGNGVEIGAGASYRTADMNMEEANVAGTTFKRNGGGVTIRDGEYSEVQVALETAWKTDYFIPYIGVKYSDVEVDADFTADGALRKATGKESSQNVGVFVGLTIVPKIEALAKSERLTINVEGRFIDEEAVSAGVTYKF